METQLEGATVMTDHGAITIVRLLERAALCRRLARQALSYGVATELEKLASDYEKDAVQLEQWSSPRLTSSPVNIAILSSHSTDRSRANDPKA